MSFPILPSRRHLLAATLLGAVLALAPRWPRLSRPKPSPSSCPSRPRSATDQLARALGQSITEQTKQPVVVENKAGASGMMAAQAAAKAPADGHTVLITTNTTHAANEHLYKKLPYDPVKDFLHRSPASARAARCWWCARRLAVQDRWASWWPRRRRRPAS